MKRTYLTLDEKIKLLGYRQAYSKTGVRDIAIMSKIGKTATANIIENGKQLRRDYEGFKGTYKKLQTGKFHKINEIVLRSVFSNVVDWVYHQRVL